MKNILIIISSVLLIACGDIAKKKTYDNSDTVYILNNYAVVWKWKTKDMALVDEKLNNQIAQLSNLWTEVIVENNYFEQYPKTDSFGNYPGISFFIKAPTEAKAKKILDEMIFVKHDISEYAIYPVGPKWLGRNEEIINARKIT